MAPLHSENIQQEESQQAYAKFGSRTDVGYVRAHNEDSLLVTPPLYVVCDGMGGHEAGEVASEIAIQTISRRAPQKLDVEELGQAVEEANIAILQAAREGRGREGMGTTCTAAMLDGNKLIIAQVGDSRAYLLHNGTLQQLTRDHSVVADLVESGEISPEDARTHQWRSYITRALGLDPYMQADLYELNVSEGDRLMLCSDGLYSMASDGLIEEILGSEPDAQIAADSLVEAALLNGGSDNITVIVADVEGQAKSTHKAIRKAKTTAIVIIALMVALIGGSIFGFSYLVNNSAYLGEQDGKVAIYRGIPGDFLGMSFSSLERVTTVSLDSLQPGIATRVKSQDIRCDSVEAAYDLVDEYKKEEQERQADGRARSDEMASSDSSAANSNAANSSAANTSSPSRDASNSASNNPSNSSSASATSGASTQAKPNGGNQA